ncbi:MAG: D-aminoacyl-tRNA deacylase [Ruminococcus bromii]|nr:D-aminoacyl-tRNA deacylase [Ruminococcus bromii]
MRAVIQRMNGAVITIDGTETREVKEGVVIFICAMDGDTDAQADFLAQKVCELRIFKDENDKMNRSLIDIHGDILIVSNITLSADMKHGRRPDFSRSASPAEAKRLYEYFIEQVKKQPIGKVCTGEFGAHMHVNVQNDGPVNIVIDTERIGK